MSGGVYLAFISLLMTSVFNQVSQLHYEKSLTNKFLIPTFAVVIAATARIASDFNWWALAAYPAMALLSASILGQFFAQGKAHRFVFQQHWFFGMAGVACGLSWFLQ